MMASPPSLLFWEDGEKGALCSMLTGGVEAVDLARGQLTTRSFYVPAHQIIYDLIVRHLEAEGRDQVSLARGVECTLVGEHGFSATGLGADHDVIARPDRAKRLVNRRDTEPEPRLL